MTNQTLIVTGCAGFIGWKVSEQLLEGGATVIGVDNINDAYDVRMKEWRLEMLFAHNQFQFHRFDIANRQAVRNFGDTLWRTKPRTVPDAVIHLAARAGVRTSVLAPYIYYETNVTGTLNMLEFCRELGVRKFVLASTSSLYGTRNERPFVETADTNGPLSPYAASKKAAETLCYTYHYLHGIDISIPRYFTVYGPAGRPDMSLFRFVQWIAEDRPVRVYGDGRQSRDFTYIDDIARGTIACLQPCGYEIINLGSDQPIVLVDVIRTVETLLRKDGRLHYEQAHPADVKATWAEISKARKMLGWQPTVTFQEGVRRLVDWYLVHRSWASRIDTGT